MEQLIFVGIIVLFSILEAVARKKKQAQGQGEGVPEAPDRGPGVRVPRPRPAPTQGTVPRSYDDDTSFDEAAKGDESRMRPEPAAERAAPLGQEEAVTRTSSEGLIPAELWEEIQVLARGGLPREQESPQPVPPRTPAPARGTKPPARRPAPAAATRKTAPASRTGTQTPSRAARKPAQPTVPGPEAPATAEGTPDHPVHLSHAAYGTPVVGRAGSAERVVGRPVAAHDSLRRMLVGGGRAPLRQAMILQDVLGPPVSLRD
ncbi:MAG: hypothetical protein Q8N53_04620 [Longimicrobiales bacterium]|nr:hypothetical protein [Longimicrobiales bacterium]